MGKKQLGKSISLLLLLFLMACSVTGCLEEEEEEPAFRDAYWWDTPGEGGCHYGPGGLEWWCALDENWSEDDWEYTEDGLWMIYDEETDCYYFYDEESGDYAACDSEMEEFYFLDQDTGEWVLEEE